MLRMYCCLSFDFSHTNSGVSVATTVPNDIVLDAAIVSPTFSWHVRTTEESVGSWIVMFRAEQSYLDGVLFVKMLLVLFLCGMLTPSHLRKLTTCMSIYTTRKNNVVAGVSGDVFKKSAMYWTRCRRFSDHKKGDAGRP